MIAKVCSIGGWPMDDKNLMTSITLMLAANEDTIPFDKEVECVA